MQATKTGMEDKTSASVSASISDVYYSKTVSTLNKRPMSDIQEELVRKRGNKAKGLKPSAKKDFTNIVSKLDTGVKKTKTAVAVRQSDGITAKKKEELFGRVSAE